jgi:hypothetical protein
MLRDPKTGRWQWKRILVIAALATAVLAPLSAYVGYRVLFQKDPEVMRQIKESEDRQRDLDEIFAEPATDVGGTR